MGLKKLGRKEAQKGAEEKKSNSLQPTELIKKATMGGLKKRKGS